MLLHWFITFWGNLAGSLFMVAIIFGCTLPKKRSSLLTDTFLDGGVFDTGAYHKEAITFATNKQGKHPWMALAAAKRTGGLLTHNSDSGLAHDFPSRHWLQLAGVLGLFLRHARTRTGLKDPWNLVAHLCFREPGTGPRCCQRMFIHTCIRRSH